MNTSFDPKTHSYLIDGKPATGVTTVISVLAKPALIGWAAKMAAEHVRLGIEALPAELDWNDDSFAETLNRLIEESKSAHTKKKEAAGTHGTDAHALVELYVNSCINKWDIAADLVEKIKPFVEWAEANVDHFLFSERKMFNKDLFIAGTADFGCVLKTGQKLMGDFKTSSGVYGIDYYLQCAGYKILAEAEGDEKYDGCVIVRLGKKGPADFDVTYNYDCETAEKSFMACLTLYRAQAALKETAIRE